MTEFELLRKELLQNLDLAGDLDEEMILNMIDDMIVSRGRALCMRLSEKEALRRDLFYSVRRLDVIQELIDDESVTEIMVNGHEHIFFEREGKIKKWDKAFDCKDRLEDVIQQIAGKCNRVVNEQNPIVDARLENGDRVNVVLPPISLKGPILTIRRFPKEPITLDRLVAAGSLTASCAEYLKRLVEAGYSILVGGGTSTGKTTFLNALSNYIPKDERVITIEDNAELQLQGIENLVSLEARAAILEEMKEISIRELIRTALRMRPNRIIIGEVRSGEAWDFLAALNTGHDGSLGSAHANSIKEMVSRLEMMSLMAMQLPVEVIRRQIASGIEILVHLDRMRDGRRVVREVGEIAGIKDGEVQIHTLFQRDGDGELVKAGDLLKDEKWIRSEKAKG